MSNAGKNGSNGSNGSGKDQDNEKDADVIRFPSLVERDRIRREKEDQEKAEEDAIRAAYRKQNHQPFINTGKIPPVTGGLFLIMMAIHVVKSLFLGQELSYALITQAGFIPGLFTGAIPWEWSALLSPISYIFIHSDWMHIGFNCVMLLALGVFFEREFGGKRMIAFFLACGICGAAFYLLLNPFSVIPVVGASGSVSGLFGVVLLMMHERGAMGSIGKYGPWPLIGIWMVMIVGFGMMGGGNVAWQAHLGGFLGGLAILYLWRRGFIKL